MTTIARHLLPRLHKPLLRGPDQGLSKVTFIALATLLAALFAGSVGAAAVLRTHRSREERSEEDSAGADVGA